MRKCRRTVDRDLVDKGNEIRRVTRHRRTSFLTRAELIYLHTERHYYQRASVPSQVARTHACQASRGPGEYNHNLLTRSRHKVSKHRPRPKLMPGSPSARLSTPTPGIHRPPRVPRPRLSYPKQMLQLPKWIWRYVWPFNTRMPTKR